MKKHFFKNIAIIEASKIFIKECILIYTCMATVKVSMTIDKDVFSSFKSYCQKNGMKVSSKVEQLFKETLSKN